MVIAVSGTFHQILNYVMSVEMVFLSLTALSLFIIRRTDAKGTAFMNFSVPGHPATTLLFVAVNVALVLDLFYKFPQNTTIGLGIALAGIPVYYFWRRRGRKYGISRDPG